jgi:hypothetical protein
MNSTLQIGKGGKRKERAGKNQLKDGLHWTAVPFTKKKMLYVGDGLG